MSTGEPLSTSISLLESVKADDVQAWERLVKLYGPSVYRWCRQSGLQSEDAKDVFQEVFGAVALHIADFRRENPGDSFRSWLCTIARNKVRDFFRRRAHRPQAEGGTGAYKRLQQIAENLPRDGEFPAETDDRTRLVHQAAQLVQAEFENPTWTMFWRAAVRDEKPADVAADFGVSVSAVYQAKSRILRRLRQELDGLIDP